MSKVSKTCTKCGEDKPLFSFFIRKLKTGDYPDSWCRKCTSVARQRAAKAKRERELASRPKPEPAAVAPAPVGVGDPAAPSARLHLAGKYAVGDKSFSLVDEAFMAELSRWSWRATKPGSGGHTYARRNRTLAGGKRVTVFLHREVMRLAGLMTDDADGLDVDHVNHNALDNRLANLRLVSRSVNLKNRAPSIHSGTCAWCRRRFAVISVATGKRKQYCSDVCLSVSNSIKARLRQARSAASAGIDEEGDGRD